MSRAWRKNFHDCDIRSHVRRLCNVPEGPPKNSPLASCSLYTVRSILISCRPGNSPSWTESATPVSLPFYFCTRSSASCSSVPWLLLSAPKERKKRQKTSLHFSGFSRPEILPVLTGDPAGMWAHTSRRTKAQDRHFMFECTLHRYVNFNMKSFSYIYNNGSECSK